MTDGQKCPHARPRFPEGAPWSGPRIKPEKVIGLGLGTNDRINPAGENASLSISPGSSMFFATFTNHSSPLHPTLNTLEVSLVSDLSRYGVPQER